MTGSATILQSHHVIEQSVFKREEILIKLKEHGLIDQDSSSNRLYLPVEGQLAEDMGCSPHRGRTRSSYTDGLEDALKDIRTSELGIAALQDDPIALRKVAAQVAELQDTIKLALINNDAFTTTPDAIHKDAANAFNRHTFSDLAQYRADHAQQLQTLRSMSAVESEWAAVTHSEARIALVVNAAHTRTASLVAAPGDPATREVLGRMELHMSVNEAQTAGRISLSPSSRALVQQVLIDDLPSIGPVRGIQHLQPASPSLYKPLSQRGFITPDMLTGELSVGHTLRADGILGRTMSDKAMEAARANTEYAPH